MKIVLALATAVILLMVMAPIVLAADSGTTVYVSVSVDGELLVAAQPVTISDMTVEAAIKAAHAEYYSGGESGYVAGIDPMWNMYLVSRCWGVAATPFVIVNDTPLGATAPQTVDTTPVAPNDNIIICTSSDPMNNPAQPVSLMSTLSGDSATVTATSWTLDFMTFTYSHVPLANANVIDPATGASLGITDAQGSITVTVPESGVVAIEGLAAINVKNPPAPPPAATATTPASGTIPYTDAKKYIGQTVSIQAQVFEKTDAGDFWVLYLGGPSTDPNTVGIEVNKSDVSKFPADLYVGKTITITGELHTNPIGGASFSLTDPSQVQEGGVSAPAGPASRPAAPASTGTPIFYGPTISLIIWALIILTPVLVVVIVKMVRQSRLDKDKAIMQAATAVSPSAALGSTPAGPAPGFAPVGPSPAPSGPAPAPAPPISAPAPPISTSGPPAPKPAAAPAPAPVAPPGSEATVYVSVSVDGKLLVAAQPVTVTELTVQGAIKAAHAEYYSGGVSGYTAGIDPTFNMFLITRCWGIQATPYVILNGRPLGADPTVPPTVDAAPVAANDNIIICTSSDPMNKPAQPVSLTAFLSGDSATLTAKAWTLDFTTFTYSSKPLAKAKVIDPATGASLGKTDAHGRITVTVPESGVVAIEGLAAIAPAPEKRQK